ncbi:YdgH/BhsA/McbA family protein [Serratia entomophila]|jgi:hypothetical protein|uniref:hypothetical protein n=1 Tax=Serratia entomophila TaxID=42906 RepID=UPI0021781523|nr:hypothetical protein [Serratia entomophila]CAI0874591.1 Uncharacterised protein [Serratia entomophila]CAI1511784.1 Uncharacterised protein [Serratia entomophila]CAI1593591.1 Uncharacterised protein [Serratia entomophila]CAI1824984.1 Uncharacterised protein [Serratia entomophila]CAI1886972.1 Uncharacterised protein [Serratia entomophila]
MTWRYLAPISLILLSGCSAIQPTSSSPGWSQPQPATREQRQRIMAGESASSVLNESNAGIGGTFDWSKISDR